MDFMTKLEGVPSRDQTIPGMAFFSGTGPNGKTCGDCKFRGLVRESSRGTWKEDIQQLVFKSYRTSQCAKFKQLAGDYGSAVKKDYAACKYFEPKK